MCCSGLPFYGISIHSLRMEGDRNALPFKGRFAISIHSLRMEGDFRFRTGCHLHRAFQSTPSVWRETQKIQLYNYDVAISIHSLRMEGDGHPLSALTQWQISIHSLRMEGDYFAFHQHSGIRIISIHSLRMEGDLVVSPAVQADSPFQSTPSVWRETLCVGRLIPECKISIHSLRMEGDSDSLIHELCSTLFQSTPSVWRETYTVLLSMNNSTFQSTPSVWRETAKLHRKAFFISPILVQSCKKGCKRLHSAPEKMIFFEKREKNSVRNLQHLSVRL